MNPPQAEPLEADLIDLERLGVDELCRLARVSRQWVVERAEAGLLVDQTRVGLHLDQGDAGLRVEWQAGASTTEGEWRFDAVVLERVRCMISIERDFDAVPELAALVADLRAEISRLRRTLQQRGLA